MMYHVIILLKGGTNMGDFSILASRIKKLRKSIGKTQREFANYVGCTAATLSAYENGSKNPSLEIVKNVAEKCDVSIDWLCGLSDREDRSSIPKKFSDIILILTEIDRILGICIEENSFYKDEAGFQTSSCAIHISNRTLDKFLKDWAKYKKLKNTNTIDNDIYQACMTKLFKESNIPLTNERNALPFN